uniref:Ymf76 n=1 Tax=Tetrahymena thermophila TaxID=5911 RepID=Q951C0_TETTH|nr:ymf76 [Tetrahymena thermophila]AAK77563.1 ymf76 [Tetrahymena thermophila]6Z1P_Be Chain Be, Ymf76 [Tetrahymena thermophila SB210]
MFLVKFKIKKLRLKKKIKKFYKLINYNFSNLLNNFYHKKPNFLTLYNNTNNFFLKILFYIKYINLISKTISNKKLFKFLNNPKIRNRKKFKYKYSDKIKFILNILKSKKTKIKNLLFFIKYFSVLRKRQSRIFNLARVKSRLSKRRFFKKKLKKKKIAKYFFQMFKKLKFKHKKYINLINLDFYFIRNKRFFRLHRLYDIRKKYIRYLNNNRNIYKFYKFRIKHNFKFIKRHIKSISKLSIKDRVHFYELSLRNIAIKLKYAFTLRNANLFTKSGFIFLNGHQELNPFKYAYKGDIIELPFSKFILKLRRKMKKKMFNSMRKYKKYNWRTLKNKVNPEQRRLRISRFSENTLNFKTKLTKLFQYDYRTLSYCVVLDTNFKRDLTYLNKKLIPIYLLKLFNWKIIS